MASIGQCHAGPYDRRARWRVSRPDVAAPAAHLSRTDVCETPKATRCCPSAPAEP